MAFIRGKHRKQSRAVRGIAKVALAGAIVGAPVAIAAAPAANASTINWDSIAQCESSGNWAANTGNGFFGGLQFTQSTWAAFGGTGSPQNASRTTQIAVAERVAAAQGMNAWPVCSKKTGQTSFTASAPMAAPAAAPKTAAKVAPQSAPATPKAAPKAQVHSQASSGGSGDYTVKSGDTLSKIAQQTGTTWQSLWEKNKGSVSNPNLIFPGEHLVTK